jgi:glycosyltransferase involved in cell wall biosynthesis
MDQVSVIIPAYNRELYIGEAIESALRQTRPPDEIIVIDDGSSDRTAETARSFGSPVRCLSQSNQGIGAARNAGLDAARGNLIAFLDSDDLWLERKLEIQAAFLRAHIGIDLVSCHMKPFLSPEIPPGAVSAFDDKEIAACNPTCILARREIFTRTGLFETNRRGGEFLAWFARARENGIEFQILPELLVHRRVHLTNTVRDRRRMNADYADILKRHLDRGREASGMKS